MARTGMDADDFLDAPKPRRSPAPVRDQLALLEPRSYAVEASEKAAAKLFASGDYTSLLWLTLARLGQGPVTGYDWWRENCEAAGKELSINDFAPRLSDLKSIGCAERLQHMVPIRNGESHAHPYQITALGEAMLKNRAARLATKGTFFGPAK